VAPLTLPSLLSLLSLLKPLATAMHAGA